MKKLQKILIALCLLPAFALVGCSVEFADHSTDLVAPSGEQVFGKYVAVGNSLTAGFQDAGLVGFTELGMPCGQYYSYPRLIAGQLGLDNSVGASELSQPYIAWPGIGSSEPSVDGNTAGVMYYDGLGGLTWDETPGPAEINVPALLLARTIPTPYHNLGVPGARTWEILHTYDSASSYGAPYGSPNPFFDFINRASFFGNEEFAATVVGLDGLPKNITYQSASQARQAIAKGPSLATVWIGNNDVLGGAMGGNPVIGDNPLAGQNITSIETFSAQYSEMLQLLAGGMVQSTGFAPVILVANIPSITSIPYFMTEATFEAAAGMAWPWGYAEAGVELLTFPVLSWISDPAHQGSAIPSGYTLTAAEVTTVATAVGGYNQAIAGVAASVTASGYAEVVVVDMNGLMADIATGTSAYGPLASVHFLFALEAVGGNVATAAAATLFSLDGVHPNSKGYGVVANEFIAAINATLGTSVPLVDVAGITWDPMYGQAVKAGSYQGIRVSEEAAARMGAIFH